LLSQEERTKEKADASEAQTLRGKRYLHKPLDRLDYYRYIPDEGIQDNDLISIVSLPRWSARYGKNQVSTLWFITLSQQQLSNPQFDSVDDVDGLGTITFNLSAFEELILLLKRRLQTK